MRGWVQGYNAQAACNEQHLILAADVTNASADFGCLGPMLDAAREELAAAESPQHQAWSLPMPGSGTSSR
jgi:hypothetical protein